MDHRTEFLKALREHGQTIQKLAAGGVMAPLNSGPTTTGVGGGGVGETVSGPSSSGAGTPSSATGAFQGLQDYMGTQSNFQAGGANLQAGTNTSQLNNAYGNAQEGLSAQKNFLNALSAQNGIQNQNDVYAQYQNMANGQGPNPAQAMLNQQTGQNVANQAALMAGQRGGSANVGLMARQNAQQGAQTQQNAIAQGAALQAQQSQAALNNMAGIAQNQVNAQGQATQNLNSAAQNEQNILQGANSALNTAGVGMQSNMNNVNAQISQGNQSASNGLTGGLIGGFTGGLGSMFAEGGEVGEADVGEGNYAPVAAQSAPNIGNMNTSPDEGAAFKGGGKGGGGDGGGAAGGIMKMLPMLAALNKGGPVQKFANGQMVMPYNTVTPMMPAQQMPVQNTSGPKSQLGQHLASFSSSAPNIGQMGQGNVGAQSLADAFSGIGKMGGKGSGQTDDEAQEGYLDADAKLGVSGADNREVSLGASNNDAFDTFNRGGGVGDRLKSGGRVPGKPKVGGTVNTEKNDTVPALLSAGEVVLPRSVTKSADPVKAAAMFMQALLKKQGKAA